MGLYLHNGYVDIPWVLSGHLPFVIMVGGRGTGKTFGVLEYFRQSAVDTGKRFIYLRRRPDETRTTGIPELSPFKKLDEYHGYNTLTKKMGKDCYGFIDEETQQLIGYSMALSTFADVRGIDASDVQAIIFDEFIPERHRRPIKDEAAAFFNAVETVTRNRELSGDPPVQCVLLSNANLMGNPIFLELGIVGRAVKMYKSKTEIYKDAERGLFLAILQRSPISEKKKETALYKLTAGTGFAAMAVDNDFSEECTNPRTAVLKELRPISSVGEITIYRHKSEKWLFVSSHKSGSPEEYSSGSIDLSRFRIRYSWLVSAYFYKQVFFEDFLSELLFKKYMDL